MTDLQNQKQKFEYNDNQDMTGVTDARGNSFKYEYDKNHNVTKGTSAEKRILRYTYDDKENVLKSAAVSPEDETTGTWMTRTMTADKNHVATVKDARGCQVTYDWDTEKDLLNSVKDARNSTTFYTYDAKTERLTSVSKTVKAKGQDQEVKVEYGYSNDRLTRITHNGFNYGFGYDEFGKTRLVAIAGSSVVSYDYTTDPVSGTPKKLTTAVMDEKWKDKLLKWGSTGMTYDACGNMRYQFRTAAKCRGRLEQIYLRRSAAAFWDGRDAHQSQTGAAKQRIARRAGL